MPARVRGTGRDVKVPARAAGRRAWDASGGPGATCSRVAGTGQRQGRRPGGGAGEGGGKRVKTAAGQWRDDGKPRSAQEPARRMQPGCRARRGLLCGPQWARRPPERARRDAATSLGRGVAASGPRPPSPGAAARLGAARERGQDPAARAAAARTHPSAVPPPAPGLRSELHGPAAPGMPGAPVPHYTARSGASDAASRSATAAATPPPGGGPGRIRRGAQPRLRQPGPADRTASPGLASASANGEPPGARSRSAEGRRVAVKVALPGSSALARDGVLAIPF